MQWWIVSMDEGVKAGPFPTKAAVLDHLGFTEYLDHRQRCIRPGFWEAKVIGRYEDGDAFWQMWWICTTEAGVAEGWPRGIFTA